MMLTQKNKNWIYRILLIIWLVALGPTYTFGYATEAAKSAEVFLCFNLLTILIFIAAMVLIGNAKYHKLTNLLLVATLIMALAELIYNGMYGKFFDYWSLGNIVFALNTFWLEKQNK